MIAFSCKENCVYSSHLSILLESGQRDIFSKGENIFYVVNVNDKLNCWSVDFLTFHLHPVQAMLVIRYSYMNKCSRVSSFSVMLNNFDGFELRKVAFVGK